MKAVSVIVTTLNEESNIARCLESVRWADEIILVDSGSTDKTVEIARGFDVKVLSHPYENAASQKNWALHLAENDWVFFVDADEVVTPKLKTKIEETFSGELENAGYRIRRKSTFLGRMIKHCGWERDYVLRLFRKDRGQYERRRVHANVIVDGTVGVIDEPLLHHTYTDFAKYYEKFDRYTTWAAQDLFDAGRRASIPNLTLRPAVRFFRQYFLRLGFLDGAEGLILCLLSAYSVFIRYAKLWELRRGKPQK